MNIALFNRKFLVSLALILIVFGLSFLGWNYPNISPIFFWLAIAATLVIAWKRLDLALIILFVELIIGSKGYLFSWVYGNLTISIRLGLFLAVIAVWVVKYLIRGKVSFRSSKLFWPFIGFLAIYLWGILNAIIRHNVYKNIFFDANGYLYFGLIFVIYEAIKNKEQLLSLVQAVAAAIVGLGIKTMVLLVLFAGKFAFLPDIYRWVRDTRLDEITLISHNFYRVFTQSHVYSLFGTIIFLVILSLIGRKYLGKNYIPICLVFLSASLSLIISYSRSFWLSLAATFIIMLILFVKKYRFGTAKTIKYLIILILVVIAEAGFIVGLVYLPNLLKKVGSSFSLASLVEERLGDSEQAGLQSRWNLIEPMSRKIVHAPILGNGFGTEVKYRSEDPRIVAESGGWYSTYSFEWGYLDIILKIGLVGLALYLVFIWAIYKNGIKAYLNLDHDGRVIILALLLGLCALLITHLTTPYLNHPLGIGYLLICAVMFERLANINNGIIAKTS
ncbi:MAG: O-antigen ligase family protein [Patescibacteria group bacterium]|nr:O-antigen ligase family protein [Patescibacteria group bacterium]